MAVDKLGYALILSWLVTALAIALNGHLRIGTWLLAGLLFAISAGRVLGWSLVVPHLAIRSAWIDATLMTCAGIGLLIFIEGIPLS